MVVTVLTGSRWHSPTENVSQFDGGSKSGKLQRLGDSSGFSTAWHTSAPRPDAARGGSIIRTARGRLSRRPQRSYDLPPSEARGLRHFLREGVKGLDALTHAPLRSCWHYPVPEPRQKPGASLQVCLLGERRYAGTVDSGLE